MGARADDAGRGVAHTRTGFDLLAALARRPREAMSRRRLIDVVWDPAWGGDEHVVNAHVAHARRKLGDDPASPAAWRPFAASIAG